MRFIGVDPSFRGSGFAIAILEEEDNSVWFKSFKGLFDFIDFIETGIADNFFNNVVFGVENSNLQDSTFGTDGLKKQVFARIQPFTLWREISKWLSISRKVGKNQGASQYTVWWLERKFGKDAVIEISPKQKGKKITGKKAFIQYMKQEKVETFYNYSGNQDERDAAALSIKCKAKYKIKWRRKKS